MANLNISALLGKDADSLLTHKSKTIDKSQIHLPGPDFVERIFSQSSRNTQTLRSLQALLVLGGSLIPDTYLSFLSIRELSTVPVLHLLRIRFTSTQKILLNSLLKGVAMLLLLHSVVLH
jgi:hypothetical protein